jgi:hypothetical protein
MAGLTLEERNLMLRHADRSMNAVYVGRDYLLNEIQKRLDRQRRDGLRLQVGWKAGGKFEYQIKSIDPPLR